MQWTELIKLSDSQFKRLVGVKRITFNKMVEAIKHFHVQRPTNRGRPSTISLENQLLIMLMYYREYRTFFHIGRSCGLSESNGLSYNSQA